MKIVAVAGTKNTGKTTLVTLLVEELVHRGFQVGTVKHTHVKLDVERKDTWKHRNAGAKIVVGAGGDETFFIQDSMDLEKIINSVECLKNIDFLILEGYKPAYYAKISTSPLKDPFTLTQVDVSEIDEKMIKELADLVEERSFGQLANMNCGECGYENCREMALAMIKGEVKEEVCVIKKSFDVLLIIDNKPVPLNPFVKKFVKNTFIGMISALKIEDPHKSQKIQLLIQDEDNR